MSILHLRSTSEPWESVTTTPSYTSRPSSRSSVVGHMSSIPTLQVKYAGSNTSQPRNANYTSLPPSRRRDAGTAALFIAGNMSVDRGTNNGSCSRELSPVRWCDREVDGVYLGRSGWVQVQQRSLDENRRANYGILPPASTTVLLYLSVVRFPRDDLALSSQTTIAAIASQASYQNLSRLWKNSDLPSYRSQSKSPKDANLSIALVAVVHRRLLKIITCLVIQCRHRQ